MSLSDDDLWEVREFLAKARAEDLLEQFSYRHLPPPLAKTSKIFHDAAHAYVSEGRAWEDAVLCLTLLLQAKDAAVRSAIAPTVEK